MAREVKVASEPVAPAEIQSTENTQTLTNIISQALKSGDQTLLETALGVTDATVIEATLRKLPSEQVPSLIDQLILRSTKNANRLGHLLPWIRGCLFVHTSTLMKDPAGLKSVQALQSLFEQRLENQQNLLKLAGRLDLILMHVMRRTDEGEAAKIAALVHKPVAVYQADDDSDAEVDAPMASESSEEESESSADEMSVDEE